METVKWPLRKLDSFQQKHKPTAFTAAVFKKYADDDGGYLAALITYYAFLSLFPLLLVATSAVHFVLKNQPELQSRVIDAINNYFPALSDDLQSSILGFDTSGFALVFGVLITIYGVRGGAATIRYTFNRIWKVPKEKQIGFPLSALHSLLIVLVGGGGLVLAAILSSYAAGLTDAAAYRLIPIAVSFLTLVCVFYLVFSLGINSREPTRKDLFISALSAAIGIQILQFVGFYLVTHQLQSLSTLYGAFAVVLGLLFWIYLQAQVLLLAAFAGAVHAKRLWPRRLIS
ncbi:MAG TPA: YihY/virulence factor BrkB family protein [Candidatus Saccharimonadales bacterium]|nr:YihY/virulence factor BrkB family protein [Candidatus Saccharimonadales bacterium]